MPIMLIMTAMSVMRRMAKVPGVAVEALFKNNGTGDIGIIIIFKLHLLRQGQLSYMKRMYQTKKKC